MPLSRVARTICSRARRGIVAPDERQGAPGPADGIRRAGRGLARRRAAIALVTILAGALGGCSGDLDEGSDAAGGRRGAEITLYFTDVEKLRTEDCAAVVGARRRLDTPVPSPEAVLRELLDGPTETERAGGLASSFEPAEGLHPADTWPLAEYLRGVEVVGEAAYIDFDPEALRYLDGPACSQQSVKAPIERTLLDLQGITSVLYRIDGAVFEDWDA